MDNQFRKFLDTFLDAWRSCSLTEISDLISNNYKGREITGGEIVDFEFDESILGWEQGFKFVKENNAQWELNEISIIPLRADEMLVIISATILMQGEGLNTANLFFQTFKKDSSKDWKLIRSYIEAGIPIENIKRMQFN
ncbi:flavoprotein [Neobacillus rhizophilus]|uniref:Flavoprotein n=1 Tax=Neobacillus rhizophilus TaxID=2833579 RepID=A0A942U3X9_9BACI|nr:flavoprotein [Neobacillus rhizophilus]MBS4214251.1 flavoprotein [Neobacillus rhizophilus]